MGFSEKVSGPGSGVGEVPMASFVEGGEVGRRVRM